MEIGGLPLHPLVVHAAVTFTPLAALVAILFALVPRWRWLTRWLAAGSALVALLSVLAARLSGPELLERFAQVPPALQVHRERGELLVWFVLVFFVLVAVAAYTLGGSSPFPDGRGSRESVAPWLDRALPILLVVAAVGVIVQVLLTGHAGSVAVWG